MNAPLRQSLTHQHTAMTALASLAAALVWTGSTQAFASGPATAALQPHRAVYEISLLRSSVGAGIANLTGRMVYELTGSDCAGYTQKMRMVTRTSNNDGESSVSDLRSSFVEAADGRNFSFESQNFRDRRLSESSAGRAVVEQNSAGRSENAGNRRLRVRLSEPERKEVVLNVDALFPVEHSIKLLEAAKSGDRLFSAEIYDGSEKGEQIFTVIAAIGEEMTAEAKVTLPPLEGADARQLQTRTAWPVSLSYFERDNPRDDAAPTYELAFVFFDNGVSRRLMIDYGTFAIRGTMTSLTIMPPEPCQR